MKLFFCVFLGGKSVVFLSNSWKRPPLRPHGRTLSGAANGSNGGVAIAMGHHGSQHRFGDSVWPPWRWPQPWLGCLICCKKSPSCVILSDFVIWCYVSKIEEMWCLSNGLMIFETFLGDRKADATSFGGLRSLRCSRGLSQRTNESYHETMEHHEPDLRHHIQQKVLKYLHLTFIKHLFLKDLFWRCR